MNGIHASLQEEWRSARAVLTRQIHLFQSEQAGVGLSPRMRDFTVAHLAVAVAEFDMLIAEFENA